MVWEYTPPYFRFADFRIKSFFLPQQLSSQLLACCVEKSRSLECVLKEQCGFHQFLKMHCSFWPHDAKSRLNGKDPDAGKDWGQEKEATDDEMVGWHHRLNGHGFGCTLGVGEGQGGLECFHSWGRKELDTTEVNWTERHSEGVLWWELGVMSGHWTKKSL